MTEIQHAEITIEVSKEFADDVPPERRADAIAHAVHAALNLGTDFENRGVVNTALLFTETVEEAAERRMAELESAALARAEAAAERALEEGRW
ncbi:hypothetical protein [Haloferax larsenii]|uniref:Uncharacterized protein n=1 Tax=Haloferax larsenii TaxID=302484 RepID=A0A1H7N6D7_HALLR|nr:hypothetical protein [Haloferax larsenii]SEL19060.1 hypothetical protein SAMN04488691_103205 [Haloferax larsenii]